MDRLYKLYIDKISSFSFDSLESRDLEMLIDTVVKGLVNYARYEDLPHIDFNAIKEELEDTGQVEFGSYRARIIDWED